MLPNDHTEPGVWRIIDASCNRIAEGLRTIEEYVRFVLDDEFLSTELKRLRHDATQTISLFDRQERLAARDTVGDVGTAIETPTESQRSDPQSVAVAASERCQQAFRCLEEYGKLVDGRIASQIEAYRYRAYTLFASIEQSSQRRERLKDCSLQVLIDGCDSTESMVALMAEVASAGAGIIQLRDKSLDDRRLYERAVAAVSALKSSPCLLVINDRPDIAATTGADGVHVGQEELPISAARRIIGSQAIIGVSTHDIEQARTAVLGGADYLGCGPTFPSKTKSFDSFPGLSFLREVAAEIRLPAFAIGGINLSNIDGVVATGIGGVAVTNAVTGSKHPAGAVRQLKFIREFNE